MKTVLKKCFSVLKALLFFVLLAATLLKTADLLSLKFSRTKYAPFFEGDRDYDVLLFGSSRIEVFLSPFDLWQDYGITSYNFGNASERVPATYWTMRNVFEYCTPKVAVIDMCMFGQNEKYTDGGIDPLHKAWDSFPLTVTKIETVWDMLDDNGLRLEFLFPFGKYHSRWNGLEEEDFNVPVSKMKGLRAYDEEHVLAVNPQKLFPVTLEKESLPEDSVDVIYLCRILELCREKGVEPLLLQTPFRSEESRQKMVNSAEDIAAEYGARFLNLVAVDGLIDPSVDMFDTGHVNAAGMHKVTDYLGDYLARHYQLPDRGSGAMRSAWKEEDLIFREEKLRVLEEREKLESALMLLHDDDLSCAVSIPGDSRVYESETLTTLLQNICREHLLEGDGRKSADLRPLAALDEAAREKEAYFLVVDNARGETKEYLGPQSGLRLEFAAGSAEYAFGPENDFPALVTADGKDLFAVKGSETWRGAPDLQVLVWGNGEGEPVFVKQFWLTDTPDASTCFTNSVK